ncbi:MAG: TolC family protein [Daejeonella sp.]
MNKYITRYFRNRALKMMQKYGIMSALALISMSGFAQETKHLTLQQALDLGIQNSKQLKISQSRIDIAKAKYEQLRSLQYPQVKVNAGYARLSEVPEFIFPGQSQSFFPSIENASRVGVSVVQPIFGGFRAKSSIESGKFLIKASEFDAEKDRSGIALNIVNAYYNFYKLQQSKNLVDENLSGSRQRLKDVENLAKNGVASRNDILRSDLQVSTIRLSQIDAENNIKIANYNMNILLGLPENTILTIDSASIFTQKDLKPYQDYVDDAAQNRSELKGAEIRTQTAINNLKITKANYFPVVSLVSNYLNANPNQRLVPAQAKWYDTWDVGIGLSYDITSIFTNKHNISEAKTQIDQTRIFTDQLSDVIKMELNQNYIGYQQQLQKIDVNKKAVEQATENYRMVKNKYMNQVALLTDVLDADILLLQSKLNYAVAQADAEIAYQTLLQSTGKL